VSPVGPAADNPRARDRTLAPAPMKELRLARRRR
jgi:hypothetical protein